MNVCWDRPFVLFPPLIHGDTLAQHTAVRTKLRFLNSFNSSIDRGDNPYPRLLFLKITSVVHDYNETVALHLVWNEAVRTASSFSTDFNVKHGNGNIRMGMQHMETYIWEVFSADHVFLFSNKHNLFVLEVALWNETSHPVQDTTVSTVLLSILYVHGQWGPSSIWQTDVGREMFIAHGYPLRKRWL